MKLWSNLPEPVRQYLLPVAAFLALPFICSTAIVVFIRGTFWIAGAKAEPTLVGVLAIGGGVIGGIAIGAQILENMARAGDKPRRIY